MTTLWPTPPDWHHLMVSRVHRVPGICLAVVVLANGLMLQEMATPDQARRLAQELALLLQAGLLTQIAPKAVWQAFCESRLAGHGGQTFGMLGPQADVDAILARA